MANKVSKSYSSTAKSKKAVSNKSKAKTKNVNNTDVTTRIRIDDVRLNDSESLDTSFLEGRYEKNEKKNSKKVKEKILKDTSKRDHKISVVKKICMIVFIIILIVLFIFLLVCLCSKISDSLKKSSKKNKEEVVEMKKKKEKVVVDRNYLFVGDFNTCRFDLEEYDLDDHYVKSCDDDLTTEGLLDDLKTRVFDYNPSIVFIELGIVDMNEDISGDNLIVNYGEIIDQIQNKRPYAEIYLVSIYPINRDVDNFDDEIISKDISNDDIKSVNKRIKKLADTKKINYLNVNEMLLKEDDLDKDYTDNGIYLNEDGYKQVLKVINKVIE